MKQIVQPKVTRREALARVGKIGLVAGALGGPLLRSLAAEVQPQFKFIVVNDTHYMSEACGKYLAGLVEQMNNEGAALCLHAGDVTDKGEPALEAAARAVFARLDLPFYCVPGNHDWVSPTDRTGYTNAFPQRLNYAFTHGGWQFIGLDTTEGQKYENTRIQPATFAALPELLAGLAQATPTVVFTHFPLCENVKMRPLNADDLLAKFDGWNVKAFFSGHFHGFTECDRGAAHLTTNRCCSLKRDNHDGTKEKGYFVCEVSGETLTRRFVEYKGGVVKAP